MSLDNIIAKYKNIISSGERQRPYIYYPTGIFSVDRLLGGKGFQGGKIVEILAENKSGKSTMAYRIIAQAQANNKRCVLVDYERTHSQEYSSLLGVDNQTLIKVTAPYMDEAAELVETMIETGEIGVIVIDSIPAAMHSSEKEKNMSDSERMAGTAGDWTRHLKRIVPLADDTDTLVVLINQYRANMTNSPMVRTEKKPWGARYIQYASSYILDLARIKNEDGKATVQVAITKNKVNATEGHKTDLMLEHGKGFRADLDVFDMAVKYEIIRQSGKWYYFEDVKAQGKENAVLSFPMDDIKLELERRTSNVYV